MEKTPEIFLSHSWSDKETAEKIYKTLTQVGLKVKMDNHELQYKDSLVTFMDSIRDCDFAILLISDKYLKSRNCLYEVINLLKEKTYNEKVFPILLNTAKIFTPHERLTYLQYWTNQQNELDQLLKAVDPINAIELYNDLKIIVNITQSIDSFLKDVSNILNITFEQLEKNAYKDILERIGYIDLSYVIDLIYISLIENIEEKELELDRYLTKYTPNTFYYGIKAETYFENNKLQQAKLAYEQSIELNPTNASSLNNLGLLCNILKEYKSAKDYFERVIKVDPKHTIARLNLGLLLAHHFDDNEGAKQQYEEILSYDPNEYKAHNNIANYYKKTNYEKAKYHLKQAISLNPHYVEAYINFGNLLKINGELEEGNDYYRQALKITNNPKYIEVINFLLTIKKG